MKKRQQIGIEVSAEQLHITVASKQEGQWHIIQTISIPFQVNRLSQVFQSLRQHIAHSIGETIIGLPYHQVMIKEIKVDHSLTQAEIYHYLQERVFSLFGEPASAWHLDFEKISSISPKQTSIRAVAAPKSIITQWRQLCQQNGFKLMVVDVDVLSLLRLPPWLQEYNDQRPQALMWVKKIELIFIVIDRNQLVYVKRSDLGPNLSIIEQLTIMIKFFNGLFPQCDLEQGFLFGELEKIDVEALLFLKHSDVKLKVASINQNLVLTSQQFCSLALSVHPYAN